MKEWEDLASGWGPGSTANPDLSDGQKGVHHERAQNKRVAFGCVDLRRRLITVSSASAFSLHAAKPGVKCTATVYR
jgi:hypothetical protein